MLVVKAHRGPRAIKGLPVLKGRPDLPELRERKPNKVSQGRKDQKGNKARLVRKALKATKERLARPGRVCTS